MANANTIAAIYNKVGPTSSSATAIATTSGGSTRAVLGLRPDLIDATHLLVFRLRAVSKALASGACNFTQKIYWNSQDHTDLTTFTNDKLLFDTSTHALASTSGLIVTHFQMTFDPVSGRLAGNWDDGAGFANIETTPAIVKSSAAVLSTNPVVDGLTDISDIQFFVTHTMSANATSSYLVELAIDQI